MKKNDDITIVVACDDHYFIMLAALLKSIEENHVSPEHIQVIIVDDNVSARNKLKLKHSIDTKKISLSYIKMRDAITKDTPLPLVKNTYPLNTYIRLFIPHFIPASLKKVIFMDVDMIVKEDISKLWHTDIGDHIIAAAADWSTQIIKNGVTNYKALGLDPEAKYFNAGLQIINNEKWRKEGITKKIIDGINKNAEHAGLGDQYGLNITLSGQWHELDPMWNYFANGKEPNPYLIHFFHRKPFYTTYSNNPEYRALFYEYLNKTAWKGTKPVGELKRNIKKIINVLEKIPLMFSR